VGNRASVGVLFHSAPFSDPKKSRTIPAILRIRGYPTRYVGYGEYVEYVGTVTKTVTVIEGADPALRKEIGRPVLFV
jgi:hypothetical protein